MRRRRAAAPPQDGYTALMWAAQFGKLDCLKYLTAKGANLEAKSIVSAALPFALRAFASPTARPSQRHRSPRVWDHRGASAGRNYGPHVGG